MANKKDGFKVADLDCKQKDYLKQVEQKVKADTGKDVVLIEWEKK